MSDTPIHLAELNICHIAPHTEASVTVPVWITQSNLDGLQTLLTFISGFEAGGHGKTPGAMDVLMLYRTIRASIYKAEQAAKTAHQDPEVRG